MKTTLIKRMHLFLGQEKMAKYLVAIISLLITTSLQAKEWAFDVYLDQQKIGTHTFKLDNNRLTSQADFKVKILFFNAYEYHHTALEQWDKNCLVSLKADTTEKGETFKVVGEKTNNAFKVVYNQTTQSLPTCTMTFAYWNPAILEQKQLLNPQNAEYLDVNIKSLGDEDLQVNGKLIQTKHYEILGALNGKPKLNIQVWYDENKNWVSLKSTTPEGYEIYYRLKSK